MGIFRKILSIPFFLFVNVLFLLIFVYSEKVTSFVPEKSMPPLPFLEDSSNPPDSQKEKPLQKDQLPTTITVQEQADEISPQSNLEEVASPPKEKSRNIVFFKGEIKNGDNVHTLLNKNGVSHKEVFSILKAVKPVYNLNKIKPGNSFEVGMEEDEFVSFSYDIDNELNLTVLKDGDQYSTRIEPIHYDIQLDVKNVTITDNLFNAVRGIAEKPALAFAIADIFAWDIDFFKDVRSGDRLKVVMEKKSRNGKFVGYKRVSAVEYINQGEKFTAIYFPENKDYYTDKGEPLKKNFLKAPLRFSRISSGFSLSRFHPILKKRVPHYGVDYAAPIGTPVHSVSDGEIVFVGRRGASGKLIRIKHNNVYTTGYCHLNRFAKGLRVGSIVKQGQFIGTVGMTGRATGPHLDYQIRKNGKPINPLKFDPPKINPISDEQQLVFSRVRDEMVGLLNGEQLVFQNPTLNQ